MSIVLSRKFGMLAGLSAALYVATVPLCADNGRDVLGSAVAILQAYYPGVVLER